MTVMDRLSGVSSSIAFKAQARVKTTTNIVLSGFQVIDGVTLADGDPNLRVLVGSQTDQTQNGVYDASSGVWTRAQDFDANTDFANGTQIYVQQGTQTGRWRVTTADPVVLGTSAITFAQVTDTTPVINDLTTGGTASALSAEMGKTLKGLVDGKLAASDVVNNTTTGGAAVPLSAEQGKTLAQKRPSVEKTASYTLALTEAGYLVRMNVGTANNLTVPPNSDVAFPVDTMIDVAQMGAGQTTIVASSGVTIRSSGAKLKITGQYSAASLQKIGTDEWLLVGDITS